MTYMHRIWLGSEMPKRYREYGDLWSELNPNFHLTDWNEEMIMDHEWWNTKVLEDLYTKSKLPGADLTAYWTQVADVLDYELIWRYGGWYFNTDLKPIKSLDTLEYDRNNVAFAMEDDTHPVNMAMYGPRDHPFFARIIDLLPQRYFSMPGAFMNATTGVQLIEHAISSLGCVIPVFERQVFNPIHWSEVAYGAYPEDKDYPDETVAVHEWLHRTNQRGQRVIED